MLYHIVNQETDIVLSSIEASGPSEAYDIWENKIGGPKVRDDLDTLIHVLPHSVIEQLHKEYSKPATIIIEYFVRESYGRKLEHIVDDAQRRIVQNLTRQKTIDGVIRELLRDLTGGAIIWKQVLAP